MPLPDVVRVKLSSEAAEAISLTPVVVRDMPTRELVEHMLGVTGKEEARIRELLLRGVLVSGSSRFRWTGWEAEREAILALLATFPDPEPQRLFAPDRCVRAVLRGGRQAIEIPRDAGVRKRLFRRRNFWELLMEVASAGELRYETYSYKDRADRYQASLHHAAAARLRAGATLITYTTLRDRIASEPHSTLDLYVERALTPTGHG